MTNQERRYHTTEFALLAGVSARTLRFYDRIGLLKPLRTGAGYRTYGLRDLERLEQIVALKFIGVPLKRIGALLSEGPAAFAHALSAQRRTLIEKRNLLDAAVSAITEAEAAVRRNGSADASIYQRIIEVIEMQTNDNAWNEKYESLVNAKIARLKALSPEALATLREQWAALIQEVRQAIGDDPAGPRAQELATRWIATLEALMGGPVDQMMMGDTAAYQRRDGPGAVPPEDRPVWDFMVKAITVRR